MPHHKNSSRKWLASYAAKSATFSYPGAPLSSVHFRLPNRPIHQYPAQGAATAANARSPEQVPSNSSVPHKLNQADQLPMPATPQPEVEMSLVRAFPKIGPRRTERRRRLVRRVRAALTNAHPTLGGFQQLRGADAGNQPGSLREGRPSSPPCRLCVAGFRHVTLSDPSAVSNVSKQRPAAGVPTGRAELRRPPPHAIGSAGPHSARPPTVDDGSRHQESHQASRPMARTSDSNRAPKRNSSPLS
jgi:hypothetical protein